ARRPPPRRARAGGGAPPPRGLHLVEGVAVAWGVWSRGRHGKTVWALVASRAP
ncbi:ATP-binding protein, partial [Streptomyces mirabilis]